MIRTILLLVAACLSGRGLASDLEIYLMEVPPLTMNTAGQKGIVGDIVLEAMRRAGYTPKIIVVPSNRALAVVASPQSSNKFIIPLARVPEREEKYTWISSVIKVKRAFFTVDQKVNSFDEARTSLKTIGVSRGTAGLTILQAAGIQREQIYEINQVESGFRMLLVGRIDGWFGPLIEGRRLLKQLGLEGKVSVSPALGETYNYLGCSKSCDPEIAERMSQSLKVMEKDGSLAAILRRYGVGE